MDSRVLIAQTDGSEPDLKVVRKAERRRDGLKFSPCHCTSKSKLHSFRFDGHENCSGLPSGNGRARGEGDTDGSRMAATRAAGTNDDTPELDFLVVFMASG